MIRTGRILVAIAILAMLIACASFIGVTKNAAADLAAGNQTEEGAGVGIPSSSAGGTTFVMAATGEPDSLDPAWDYETAGGEIIQNVYETLVAFDGPSAIDLIPRLATEVPSIANGGISADGLNCTFHLRTVVQFHDGTIMDADDVIYSIKRCIMMNDFAGPSWMLAQLLYPDWPGNGVLLDESVVDASMTKVDSATVVFHLITPSPTFLCIMTCSCASIVSNDYVELHGGSTPLTRNEWMNTHECGTGPYMLDFWTPSVGLTMRSFPGYWRAPAAIEQIEIKIVYDESVRQMMLVNGEASSVIATRPSLSYYETLPSVRVFKDMPTFNLGFFGFNEAINTIGSPLSIGDIPVDFFTDIHIRKAFVEAFDYDAYQTSTNGSSLQPNGPIPKGMFGYDPSVPKFVYNLTSAASELTLAPNPDAPGQSYADTGFTIDTYYYPTNPGEMLACSQLKQGLESLSASQLGLISGEIVVNMYGMDWSSYNQARANGWMPISYAGWAVDYPDPSDFAFPICHELGWWPTIYGISNHTLSNLVDQALMELDSSLRAELYSDIQMSCYDNAYYLWINQPTAFHVERTWVQGYYFNPIFNGLYYYDLSLNVTLPSEPFDLSCQAGNGYVNLTWSSSNITGDPAMLGYRIYRGADPLNLQELASTTSTEYLDTAVFNGQNYYYQVTAYSQVGESQPTAIESATPSQGPLPLPPTNVTVDLTPLGVIVNWSLPDQSGLPPVQWISVHFDAGDPVNSTYGAYLLPGETEYYAFSTELVGGWTYHCYVTATNTNGESNRSNEVVFVATFVPGPIDWTAEAGNGVVYLDWSTPDSGGSPILGYNIYRSTVGVPGSWHNVSVTGNHFSDTTVTNGVEYMYEMMAENAIGIGWSSGVAFVTPGVPSPPLNLNAGLNGGVIQLRWSPPMNDNGFPITEYRIYTGGFGDELLATVNGSTTSFDFTNLSMGAAYYFNVRAANVNGESEWSNWAFVQVPPSPPLNLTAVAGDGYVYLSWDPPASNSNYSVDGYNIYRRERHDPYFSQVGNNYGWQTYFNDSSEGGHDGPLNGNTYTYYVTAETYYTQSEPSNEVTIAPGTGDLPYPPQDLLMLWGDGYVNFSWSPPGYQGASPVIEFRVYRMFYDQQGGWQNVTVMDPYFNDTNVTNGQRYIYSVSAVNAIGEGPISPWIDVTPGVPGQPWNLGVEQLGAHSMNLTWYPPLFDGGNPILGYRVYRENISASPFPELIADVGASVTNYIDTQIGFGFVYIYYVSAYNLVGESSLSDGIYYWGPPSPPLDLGATAGNGYIDLYWSPPETSYFSPISAYRIYRLGGDELVFTLIGEVGYWQTSFTDMTDGFHHGPLNGVDYTYFVTAVGYYTESDPSNTVTARWEGSGQVPDAPEYFWLTWGDGWVYVTWNPPNDYGSPIFEYRVYRTDQGMMSGWYNFTTPWSYFNDYNVVNGQVYYYEISAVNAYGEGPRSLIVDAYPGTPSYPVDLHMTSSGMSYVDIAWSPPYSDGGSPITGYRVYRVNVSVSWILEPYADVGPSTTDFSDTQAAPGFAYIYYVRAINAYGDGQFSMGMWYYPPPGPPLGLTAKSGNGYVQLSWSPPTAHYGYQSTEHYSIYRSQDPNPAQFTLIGTVDGMTTQFNDTSPINGVSYHYYVAAYNYEREGVPSNIVTVVPGTVPSKPLNLEASAVAGVIYLNWDPPASNGGLAISGYEIFRGLSSGSLTHWADVPSTSTSYEDWSVALGTTYHYKVRAVNAKGEGALSDEASATPILQPSAPLGLAAEADYDQIVLTWSAPASNGGSAITAYKIYRSTVPGGETYFKSVHDVLRYVDRSVDDEQSYYYRLSAVNAAGEGPLSDEANATVPLPPIPPPPQPTAPSAPQTLQATPGDGAITLEWQAPASNGGASITDYRIYRGTSSGSETYLAHTSSGAVLSYIDLDVMPGTQYYYLVSAVNSAGVSAGSNEAVVNYVTVPAAPQDLKAQASDGMISLTWKAPSVNGGSAVTSYRIYRGLTSGGEEYLASSTAPGYDDTTASPGLIYHYRVSAVNAMGEGPASSEASISLPNVPTPPAAPTNLKATSGSGFVTLTWTPAADADAQSTTYWVYRMNFDTNQWELVAKVNGVLYTDSNLVNGKVYAYAVVANDTMTNSGMTPTVTATPTAPPAALTSLDAFIILVIIAVPLVLLIVWIRRKGDNGNT